MANYPKSGLQEGGSSIGKKDRLVLSARQKEFMKDEIIANFLQDRKYYFSPSKLADPLADGGDSNGLKSRDVS